MARFLTARPCFPHTTWACSHSLPILNLEDAHPTPAQQSQIWTQVVLQSLDSNIIEASLDQESSNQQDGTDIELTACGLEAVPITPEERKRDWIKATCRIKRLVYLVEIPRWTWGELLVVCHTPAPFCAVSIYFAAWLSRQEYTS